LTCSCGAKKQEKYLSKRFLISNGGGKRVNPYKGSHIFINESPDKRDPLDGGWGRPETLKSQMPNI